jgi:NADPH:quinone reductase-like Zn-dependent oxidoreductase
MERDRLSFDVEDKLSESIFVGEVLNSDPSAEVCAFNNGAPVTSLRKCSVKSRLVSVPAESLISLPKKLDAGEVAALVSTYLPAFGALHHGREVRVREKRFLRSSFKMQKILVTGGGTSEADAVVKLALLGGAFRVFLVKSRKTVGKNHIGSHRVIRLNDDPKEWLSRLDGLVDVVVDLEYPKNFEAIQASVAEEGRIVCRAPASSRSLLKNLVQIKEQAALCFVKGATMYDFDDMCESNNSDVLVS